MSRASLSAQATRGAAKKLPLTTTPNAPSRAEPGVATAISSTPSSGSKPHVDATRASNFAGSEAGGSFHRPFARSSVGRANTSNVAPCGNAVSAGTCRSGEGNVRASAVSPTAAASPVTNSVRRLSTREP